MSCLLCLRNEGIQFPNESQNDLEILRGLFELPQEFAQTFEGNQCCSVCRVKLQFVEVIKQEIGILSEKLIYFKEEVKGIFVNSFDGNEETIESNETFELAIQARRKLLKELDMAVDNEEYENTAYKDDSQVSEIEIRSPWEPDDLNENSEIHLCDPLKVEPIFNCEFEQNEEIPNPVNFHVAEIPNVETNNQKSYEPNQYYLEIKTSFIERPTSSKSKLTARKSKLTKPRNSKTHCLKLEKNSNFDKGESSKSNANNLQLPTYRRQGFTPLSNPKGRKLRSSLCFMCNPRIEFEKPEEYEEHLKFIHPSRPYSKCLICSRVIAEDKFHTRLATHMKMVHMSARSYKCQQCGATFKASHHLKTHSQIHLKREIFICEHCESTITGQRNFKIHMKRQHPEIDS